MRIYTVSRPRLLSALVGLFLLAATWSAPGALAQVSLPGTDDVESQVKQAGDQVEEAVEEVKDTVEGAGDAVKNAVQDPAGTVQGATGTVTGTVEGAQEQAGGTTTTGSAGSTTTAASAGSGARERKKDRSRPAGDRTRRGKKSATKAGNDVKELVSGGNEISGTEVAGTRIQGGGEEGSGALSLTGAALLAYLVVGAGLLSAGSVLVRWVRDRRGPERGRLLEGRGL